MSLDLKITGGTIVDGSGKERFTGDIGVKDGVITAVGKVDESADREIDASGAIVTPGFVDLHTHYDGQISWDEQLSPSVNHGTTTAVMGSCGVGFAPARKEDRQKLIDLMEGVEDIPGAALAEGIKWNWESFPEYMDALDAMPHTIDFAAQIPHDALRVYVMGERGLKQEDARADDIARMKHLLKEAMEAGAAGFTTGRSDVHRSASGDWTPASEATIEELTALASVFKDLPYGVLQAVSDFDMERTSEDFGREFEILEKFAAAAGPGRPFSLSLNQRDFWPDLWQKIMVKGEEAKSRGIDFRFQVAPRAIGVNLGLQCTFHPFIGKPSYQKIAGLSLEERVKAMQDPELKEKILSEESVQLAGDGTPIPPLVDKFLATIDKLAFKLFELGEEPNYEQPMERSLGAQAKGMGKNPLELVYECMLKNEGRALIYFPIYNYTEFNYDNVLKMMNHPQSLPGLSDSGAHVGTVCDASFPTYLLSYWTRDRAKEKIQLERAIQMMTLDTATHMGYPDRGLLAVGKKADINVIDYDKLFLKPPRMIQDLPAGGQRLLQEVSGYIATIVSGKQVIKNDELTGEKPGRLVRTSKLIG